MTTGELIKFYRISRRISQKELAKRAGMCIATIQAYEYQKYTPKIAQCEKIANALQIPVNILLDIPSENFHEKTLADYTTDELIAEIKRRIEGRKI